MKIERKKFGLRWQSEAATPLWNRAARLVWSKSGVALHFPPHSKTLREDLLSQRVSQSESAPHVSMYKNRGPL